MQRTVGWIRLYSNGVAIRVMLEYIDYWGDQRVGNDGMTPVASRNGEKDQGSKPPILFLPPRHPSPIPIYTCEFLHHRLSTCPSGRIKTLSVRSKSSLLRFQRLEVKK